MTSTLRRAHSAVPVHEDQPLRQRDSTEELSESSMDGGEDLAPPSDGVAGSEDEEDQTPDDIDDAVLEDMQKFEASFKNISQRYRLINRIGEGTFSTVYKAEDLLYQHYQNDWDYNKENDASAYKQASSTGIQQPRKPRYVAIKKIYVTSSPLRILNELELLHQIRDSPAVCPLITAFRHQDQVIAILPYFPHRDFRDYYRTLSVPEIKVYTHALLTALKFVHAAEILHRDIKPTNFLYDPRSQRGVLVDFGLAEREGTDYVACNCCYETPDRNRRIQASVYASTIAVAQHTGQPLPRPAYPANDPRSSRRANRAGTRGFRAPEVLLKCTAQTTAIDIWSVGIILLTFLSRRFPFFHSADDIDAFIELGSIFGRKKLKEVALLHGQVVQTNIPTLTEAGYGWEKILHWTLGRPKGAGLTEEEGEAVQFMKKCLELDYARRVPAEGALNDSFFDGVDASGRVGVERQI